MATCSQPESRVDGRGAADAAAEMAVAPRDWDECQLVQRVLCRDDAAWAELVRRYRSLIYRCITTVTNKWAPDLSMADIDDIYAEVMMRFLRDDLRKIRIFDPTRGAKLSSWIGMLTVNTAHDYLRGVGKRPFLERIDGAMEEHDDAERSPLDLLLEKERWAQLNVILSDFSERDRTFMHLYYQQGLDAADVADEMSISVKTVYSKNHKIRRNLRQCIERGYEHSAIADLLAA